MEESKPIPIGKTKFGKEIVIEPFLYGWKVKIMAGAQPAEFSQIFTDYDKAAWAAHLYQMKNIQSYRNKVDSGEVEVK